ncbi:hypothetical protein C0Q70_06701 [Pomacea canaliculata]|uniref:Secreted protein n=1 Tax=Pomacea canaliculata TaxID=400727 RepID=A0A2T7PD06_POMCA|nr:hypothetical protein C0Q70_06701 [Pomacea canaliculata]
MRHLAVVVAMLMMLCLATPGACSPAARAPLDEVLSEPLLERGVLVDDPWAEPRRLPDDPPSSEPLWERRVLSEQLDDPWVEPRQLADPPSSEPRPVLAAV